MIPASTKKLTKIAGILYLVIIVVGIFSEMFVRSKLIVAGNPSATASNIVNSEGLWRIGFAAEVLMLTCDVTVAVLLYILLKPVNKNIALLATSFRLVSIAISGLNSLNHFAAVPLLSNAEYLSAFDPAQINAMVLLALRMQSSGYNISLVFFGFHCLFLGYLLYRSGYFPKVLGVLLAITCLCYLTNSFSWFLAPKFASVIFPAILVPCLIGELCLSLWLLFIGVDVSKYNDRPVK